MTIRPQSQFLTSDRLVLTENPYQRLSAVYIPTVSSKGRGNHNCNTGIGKQ